MIFLGTVDEIGVATEGDDMYFFEITDEHKGSVIGEEMVDGQPDQWLLCLTIIAFEAAVRAAKDRRFLEELEAL